MGRELVKAMAAVDVDHLRRVDEELLVRVHGQQHVAHVRLQRRREQNHLTNCMCVKRNCGRKEGHVPADNVSQSHKEYMQSGPTSNFLAYDVTYIACSSSWMVLHAHAVLSPFSYTFLVQSRSSDTLDLGHSIIKGPSSQSSRPIFFFITLRGAIYHLCAHYLSIPSLRLPFPRR